MLFAETLCAHNPHIGTERTKPSTPKDATIVWLRLDLRLTDNPALHAAQERGQPVVPVFIHAPEEEAPWPPGGASRWWLHQSLAVLDQSLRAGGSRLILRRGPSLEALKMLAKETGATAVFWNRRYEPALIARDRCVEAALRRDGIETTSFNSALLHEPWTVANKSGKPFQVFTPFWKHCLGQAAPAAPLGPVRQLQSPIVWPKSLALEQLELEPKIDWSAGLRAAWQPGEAGAQRRLKEFLAAGYQDYGRDRNRPDLAGTSRLSPHLHFGEIGPRQIWEALQRAPERSGSRNQMWRTSQFLAELGWREFAHHLLHHFPHTPAEPLRAQFKNFPWRSEPPLLEAWRKGLTGYPIVDGGMHELWTTGWMHNRVRMIAGSFLVKDLLVSWSEGARWFWDTLVDADLAQNTLGWQWVAGCGADAAPYFRVFNPISQGEKFDPTGGYVRRWCPELARLPDRWLHRPGSAPADVLSRAGVRLGSSYPEPIVSHFSAREIALQAYARTKTA